MHAVDAAARNRAAAGFSLVEALVASTLLAAGAAVFSQLFVVAVLANRRAGHDSIAVTLAADKIEELRAAPFADLAASPGGSLDANITGHFEYLDGAGRVIGGSGGEPDPVRYTRRWMVGRAALEPSNLLILQVRVVAALSRDGPELVTARARKGP
jgi:hypothetical protein